MPFTFAHPAYALPIQRLSKRYVSMTGIILGSMAPDFEYFIALEPYQHIGHTLKGLLLEALPLSVLLAFLFHRIVKQELAHHLPSIWQLDQRAAALMSKDRWSLRSHREWIRFLLSVAIGFYSHVAIDAFTHASGAVVVRSTWLQGSVFGIPVYKYMQHGLSLLGLAFLGIWLLHVLSRVQVGHYGRKVSPQQKFMYWALVLLTAIIVWGLKMLLTESHNIIGITVVASMSGGLLGTLLASWMMKKIKTR
ncbi:DUF4184 family protein [Paenibacillus sp. 1001270B_150601_E10]|uniref:DUF4184 family protein n=1 Tax=Paenibacillus sp. 1001270B_150601_E10 TaxID=2787079 RepID=UPI00189F3C22|nr:DUF4184 family protein [Paenibacillus sp. 1001270B_150601_E10]